MRPGPSSAEPRPGVLVVDDEALVRRALPRTLAPAFEVVTVDGVDGAIARLAEGPPFDAVLCDLHLGTARSGRDLYAHVRETDPPLAARMIFMTGAPPAAGDAFGEHWIEKPFDTAALLALVRRVACPLARTA